MQLARGKGRRWHANRGIALVAVLWIIVLLAAMAISFVGTIRTETTVTRNLVDNAGNDIGVKRWELKASSTSVERTQQRLLSDIDTLLKDELREVLLGFTVKP